MISLKDAEQLKRFKTANLIEAGIGEADAELFNAACVELLKLVYCMTDKAQARDVASSCISELRATVADSYNARWT